MSADARPQHPELRVLRGEPSPAELAAVVVVLGALASRAPAVPPPRRSLWAAMDRMVRQPLAPGPGAWRASGLPR